MHMYVNMIMHTHLCIFVLCFFAQNYFTLAFLALSVAHVRSFSSSFCFWFCFRLSLLRWALAPLAQFPHTHTLADTSREGRVGVGVLWLLLLRCAACFSLLSTLFAFGRVSVSVLLILCLLCLCQCRRLTVVCVLNIFEYFLATKNNNKTNQNSSSNNNKRTSFN